MEYFTLDERGQPLPENDLEAWTRWFESADRCVARTVVTPTVTVLTTFTGVHDAEGEPPLLFETRVFGGVLDAEEVLHRTRGEALAGHGELVEWCRKGNSPDLSIREEDVA